MNASELDRWRASVLIDMVGGGPPGAAADALLSLALNDPNIETSAGVIAGVISTASDQNLRRLGVVCCGHLARVHGEIPEFIKDLLRMLAASGEMVGDIEDALGDIEHFSSEK